MSRLVDRLAVDADAAVKAIETARAQVRARVWAAAGSAAPNFAASPIDPTVIDLDATLITAHSEKERAAATFKRGFGFHPLMAFVDHGADGTGEPVAALLRPGNAGSNTAADHITVTGRALDQLPATRAGRDVLVRTDGAGGTHEFLSWLSERDLAYSVGFTLTPALAERIDTLPEGAWSAAYNAAGQVREGAWVAELTQVVDLSSWPAGMRLIVRSERPHPGAQLRFTDRDGNRLTAFVTNATGAQHAALELRHRRRARCEDRIRQLKDTGLANLPLHDFAQNQIWIAIVCLAADLIAWTQMLALTGHDARRWEPKRLRLRLFAIAAIIARRSRTVLLRLSSRALHVGLITAGLTRLHNLPALT